jgi:hypothetical protein
MQCAIAWDARAQLKVNRRERSIGANWIGDVESDSSLAMAIQTYRSLSLQDRQLSEVYTYAQCAWGIKTILGFEELESIAALASSPNQ